MNPVALARFAAADTTDAKCGSKDFFAFEGYPQNTRAGLPRLYVDDVDDADDDMDVDLEAAVDVVETATAVEVVVATAWVLDSAFGSGSGSGSSSAIDW